MIRIITACTAIALLSGLSSCSNDTEKIRTERDSLLLDAKIKDSTLHLLTISFKEIENNLLDVEKHERSLMIHASSPGDIPQITINEINARIREINSLMLANSEKIHTLQTQLKREHLRSSELSDWVGVLSDQIMDKNRALVGLSSLLNEKNQLISTLGDANLALKKENSLSGDTIAQQKKELNEKDALLNQAYFILASERDLRKLKIIDHKGKLSPDLNKVLFTQIDLRKEEYIPYDGLSKNPIIKLLSTHPRASYEFVKNDQGKKVNIRILDQDKFWEVSKYLVIETE